MTFKLALVYLMIAMALMIVYFWKHQKNKRKMSKRSLVKRELGSDFFSFHWFAS